MSTSKTNTKITRTDAIISAIGMSFDNATNADVKIFLRGLELPAHGIVLCAQSKYFETALNSRMKEADTREFKYSEGSIHAYWRTFEYMYKGEYSEELVAKLDALDDDELSKHVRVYQLADYFGVQTLKDYSLGKLRLKVQELWVSETFVDCIRDVYQSTIDPDCEMRKIVVDTAWSHFKSLWGKKPFRELVREGGDFAVDLMGKI
ncbi:BTB/POZ fold domain-containing protein [Pochonia chlamydosporia 170]|uniref:BTB/POZ fold domain-containing protein n=1 Tax=Pochonia chlamydosporia 170 TaxID=1380566 RepID=A0A179FVQ6_METCM|nr:BTB/POZ fold domain-containing protein [Pochonia chlamydosporia 170]OAQ69694.1 BTB/POZ fold domain-containing protein [Pochonia chlamydosporia 170]